MGLFGPSKDEIWSQVARDIGGDYIDRGFWKSDGLRYQHGVWEILLDTYTETDSNTSGTSHNTTYTRMRAPFVSQSNFWFKLYPENFFSSIGKLFNSQDIEVGDPFFDDRFIIKSNQPEKIIQLLSDPRIKSLIQQQPRILLKIEDNDGFWKNKLPAGTHELYFSCVGVIKETALLRALFELFGHTLNAFAENGITTAQPPNITLE
ncbi:MAG: DUF3137 domain-containing protein [Cyanobacteria bacterium P01_D01_bin.36]